MTYEKKYSKYLWMETVSFLPKSIELLLLHRAKQKKHESQREKARVFRGAESPGRESVRSLSMLVVRNALFSIIIIFGSLIYLCDFVRFLRLALFMLWSITISILGFMSIECFNDVEDQKMKKGSSFLRSNTNSFECASEGCRFWPIDKNWIFSI